MAAALILWGHALAALLCVAAALAVRQEAGALPQRRVIAALVLTALWALAVAGIDGQDVSARVILGLRDVAWLAALLAMTPKDATALRGAATLGVAAMAVALLAGGAAIVEARMAGSPRIVAALADARLCLRALGLIGGLILADRLGRSATPGARRVAIALALIWSGDLILLAGGRTLGGAPMLVAARGGLVAAAALLVVAAAGRGATGSFAMSRAAAARLLAIGGLAAYAGLVALLDALADALGGDHARLFQTAIVFGATAALLALLSTSPLRGWAKVMIAKHLFSHRYDYRAEWQRFSGTLAGGGAGGMDAAAPLGERVARAIADLTVSPAALLLTAEGDELTACAAIGWTEPADLGDTAPLVRRLAGSGRILDLDAERAGAAATAVPAALLALPGGWAIVPLSHRGGLVGAVVLARPPVDRALDWEDFDLLRVAGRQAAGALAEDAARRALADAERFDEFNRRFAFILHDIKNLVSQLSLVARNAERHAGNPAFRADMVATLTDASGRLAALLGKLSPQAARCEPAVAIEAAALLAGIAARWRATRPIEAEAEGDLWLLADRGALETVIDHLVQNAIDASAADRPVMLTAARDGGDVVVTVADRGAGMSAAFVRDRLFRPFVSTKPGGFGLGAFEARQTVEAMGGRLDVTSREGEGTQVMLRLPSAAAIEKAA